MVLWDFLGSGAAFPSSCFVFLHHLRGPEERVCQALEAGHWLPLPVPVGSGD